MLRIILKIYAKNQHRLQLAKVVQQQCKNAKLSQKSMYSSVSTQYSIRLHLF